MSCHVMSYIILYHIMSYHIISYHIISYHISYHIISYIIYHISYIIHHISYIISYHISYYVIFDSIYHMSYVASYQVRSCHIIGYPIMSYQLWHMNHTNHLISITNHFISHQPYHMLLHFRYKQLVGKHRY